MSNTVIQIENLGKQYRLGDIGTGTISHDLNRWWAKIRGKEDPFLKLGETNDRTIKGNSDFVWALKDVNFDVNRGDVLGIIGKNGAGKSTLLKILSRTTTPTTGTYKIKGRIASLLEVGTGFHPELSGRENVFLNGAILGMTKAEIRKNFDAIVDFSGVERYIDTPVKRYSSGMYVRLAFAVAAHLESEILIVDEVLAVGDQEFQDKCIGKMKDVSGQGRTVLFVSHNMGAIKSLCTKAILMNKGTLTMQGTAEKVVNSYLTSGIVNSANKEWLEINDAPGNDAFRLSKVELYSDAIKTNVVDISKVANFRIHYKNSIENTKLQFSIHLVDSQDNTVFCAINAPSANFTEDEYYYKPYEKGDFVTEFSIPENFLNENSYHLSLFISSDNFHSNAVAIEKIISFSCIDSGTMKNDFKHDWGGIIRPKLNWTTKKIS
jgi:lipopolysaccharide transport system ATP-binding protein